MVEQLIFMDEASLVGAPVPFLTINTVGPTLMQFGTDEQRERVPARRSSPARCTSRSATPSPAPAPTWPRSPPGPCATATSTSSTARRCGPASSSTPTTCGWPPAPTPTPRSTRACRCSWCPPTRPASRGRRCRTVGGTTTSATFYDDVRVPVDEPRRRGERGLEAHHQPAQPRAGGAVLGGRRCSTCWPTCAAGPTTRSLPDGRRVIDQEWVQVHLARVHAKVEFLKLINWKIAWGVKQRASARRTRRPPRCSAPSSTPRPTGCSWRCSARSRRCTRDRPGSLLRSRLERMYRSALILTFGGGTNEVQRDIIAMVGLGMPRARR